MLKFTSALKSGLALSVQQLQAAAHQSGIPTAGAILSSNLITVQANTDLGTVADLFQRHRFTSLPVVDEKQRFLGIIMISRAREDTLLLDRGSTLLARANCSRCRYGKSVGTLKMAGIRGNQHHVAPFTRG
ncbi:MAG: HPP family protein [Allorhizobium sp.]